MTAGGKSTDPSAEQDPEVAGSLAIIYAAGLAAEHIAEQKHPNLAAKPLAAAPDQAALAAVAAAAGIPTEIEQYEKQATVLLEHEWEVVEVLAKMLAIPGMLDAGLVQQCLRMHRARRSAKAEDGQSKQISGEGLAAEEEDTHG